MEGALCHARSDLLIFLDADCVPQKGWLRAMLEGLQEHPVCAGYTIYEGGFFEAVATIMDFGYQYPRLERSLKCYSSNNIAFRREALVACPMSESPMRCNCYAHALQLQANGTPAVLIPRAVIAHEPQPLVRERTRRGFDMILGAWFEKAAPEACLVDLHLFGIPIFYALHLYLDYRRAISARKDLHLAYPQLFLALVLFPFLRLIDVVGMLVAFGRGRDKNWSWDGFALQQENAFENAFRRRRDMSKDERANFGKAF
jgi:hypothetical protein